MRAIVLRERTVGDDIKSIQRKTSADIADASVTIPRRSENPIVAWGAFFQTDDAETIRSCLEWPLSSDKRCHNCAHFFEGVPVPLPVSRDELRHVFFCKGNFCSWQCAKSFNIRETSPAGRGNRNMYIALLAYKTWIKLKHPAPMGADVESLAKMKLYCNYRLKPALPRSRLVEFGGDLSIEEYRKGFCGIVPPPDLMEETPSSLNIREANVLPFVSCSTTFHGKKAQQRQEPRVFAGTKRIETNRVQEFNNSFVDRLKKARFDPAIMVRKKEVDVSNTLLSSMGIQIKKRSR